jgi:hypothetical protein
MIVKMGRRTPAPPRGGTSLSWPLTTTAPQKNEKKTFTTTSFTGILTQSTVCSTYPNYRPFYIFDTLFIENIHTLCITNSTKSSLMPPTAAYKPFYHCFNSLTMFEQWFTLMWHISQWRSTHDTTDTLVALPRPRVVPHNPRVTTHRCAYS